MDDYDEDQLALIADFLERLNAANQRLVSQRAEAGQLGHTQRLEDHDRPKPPPGG